MSRPPSSVDEAIAARLARRSRVVAEEYRRRAPPAATMLDDVALAEWARLGAELLDGVGAATGAAIAYFRVVPADVAPTSRAGWVGATLRIAAVSPALAGAFAEATAPAVTLTPVASLAAYADETLRLRGDGGWPGERTAHLFVAAAPSALAHLEPSHLAGWIAAIAALEPAIPQAQAFRALPDDVAGWSAAERADWLAWTLAVARRRPADGLAVYRDLPGALRGLAAVERAAVLSAWRRAADVVDPHAVAQVVPLLGALVTAVPASHRAHALHVLDAVAAACPTALPGAVRTLARLYEEAPPARIDDWLAAGGALAARDAVAAEAFFALESRTSRRVLHASPTAVALDEVQGVLRRYVHMLSGRTIVLRGEGPFRLALPLETDGDGGGALPPTIEVGDVVEDNARLYRVLAAWLAARRLAGTYDDPGLLSAMQNDERPRLAPAFRLADGYRTAARIAARYPGLAAELRWAGRHLLSAWSGAVGVDVALVCDGVLAAALAGDVALPRWLAPAATVALPLLGSLAAPDASVRDAATVAEILAATVPFPASADTPPAELSEYARFMLELGAGDEVQPLAADDGLGAAGGPAVADDGPPAIDPTLQFELDELVEDALAGGRALDADELARLLEQGVRGKLSQAPGLTPQQAGLYVTQLMGKLLGARPDLPQLGRGAGVVRRALRPPAATDAAVWVYDEWDHEIADYRSAWCRLRELPIADDAGVFFTSTLERHAALVPEIRRHFQRVLPETYRPVRGLEDGTDFDLNAVVEARVQHRTGHPASTKLYTARHRQEREVATLFLLDMSASTDEAPPGGEGRRIIDLAKEALVLMAAALDEIGDAFAIYGFSGQGRDHVEAYPVKRFEERLSAAVKGRIGGLEPKASTRMGAAVRHARTRLEAVTAPSRHLILLSDGFPQDLDYGRDRQSHVYGIRDTAAALREVEAAGIRPFCITVDLAGHDYLREMCDPDRYLVIERLADLPRELPKIYQRLVRAA